MQEFFVYFKIFKPISWGKRPAERRRRFIQRFLKPPEKFLKNFFMGSSFEQANLLTSGKLPEYLADIDRRAEELFLRLAKQMAEAEGITEKLKVSDQMEWVRQMNSIRNRAMEIVNKDSLQVCGVSGTAESWEQVQLQRRNPQGRCRRICSERTIGITKRAGQHPLIHTKRHKKAKRNRVSSSNSQVG